MNYTLISGVEMNAAHPDTFEIPDNNERAALVPGQYAKVGFQPTAPIGFSGERMWVEVRKVSMKGLKVEYTGVLANDPVCFAPGYLKCGDKVVFGPEHVLSILDPVEA